MSTTSKTSGRAAVLNLDPSTVTCVYSGRPGCACGCRGTYYFDQRNITRVVNLMKKRATEIVNLSCGTHPSCFYNDSPVSRSWGRDFQTVAYVETEQRYLWAFIAEAEGDA